MNQLTAFDKGKKQHKSTIRFFFFSPDDEIMIAILQINCKNTIDTRAYQKRPFFENSGAVFYFMHKCPKKSRKKISGDLRVIWPPQQTAIFYIGNSAIKYWKFHKTRKLAVSVEFQMHFPFQIDFLYLIAKFPI